MPRFAAFLFVLAAPALVGCGGSAVLVARSASGGVLAIDGEHVQAMADARRQMSEHCEGAYSIVRQRLVVTGVFRGEELSEFLVQYACGAAPDEPVSPAPRAP
jgi:hypothetical protein